MSASGAIASLSLDLDNKWSYLKTHGDAEWSEYPSYLDVAVPRILDFLQQRDITLTCFVVGQDAAIAANRDALRAIADARHEIGNHSFRHEPWLHLYTDEELDCELEQAERHIEEATGVRPIGFRGPGFSLSQRTIAALVRRGYRYDATVFPNALNPLARWYLTATSKLSAEERRRRSALFGTFTDAFRPLKPFRWRVDGGELLEIPITTMPGLRVPIHLTYLLFLSGYSRAAARAYFKLAVTLCDVSGVEPSVLLHPTDFLGRDDGIGLEFFPGMTLPTTAKLALIADALDILQRRHRMLTMKAHADLAGSRRLPTRTPGA